MKVYACYMSKDTHKTVKVEKFESKKEAREHFASVGYEQRGSGISEYFRGSLSNVVGYTDVLVTMYPCSMFTEESMWR